MVQIFSEGQFSILLKYCCVGETMKIIRLLAISFILSSAIILVSCSMTSPYVVQDGADDFSDPNSKFISRAMYDNHIVERDPMKLVPYSELNSEIFIDKKTNIPIRIILALKNVRRSDRGYSGPLYIREGDEMIIITDTKRITLKSSFVKSLSKYSPNQFGSFYYYFDFASYEISKQDFKEIANTKVIKIRVNGSEGYQDYTHSINEAFIPNFLRFYQEEIQGKM
jgi:hypothetical protein